LRVALLLAQKEIIINHQKKFTADKEIIYKGVEHQNQKAHTVFNLLLKQQPNLLMKIVYSITVALLLYQLAVADPTDFTAMVDPFIGTDSGG
jgi:hypothetical protein